MKPTILFFAPVPNFKGGAETSLQDLLHNPSINPVLVVPAEGPLSERARSEGIPVEIVPFGAIEHIHRPLKLSALTAALRDAFYAAKHLKKIHLQHNALSLHTNGMKAHMLGMLARLLGGAPVVAHVRDIPYTRPERWVWQSLAWGCKQVLVVSKPCWPTPSLPQNVKVVPNGIVPPQLPLPQPPQAGQTFQLGFCGRIEPIKGLDLLLNWMAAAREAKLNMHLAIRGEGPPDYMAELQAKVAELDLAAMVSFEGKKQGLEAIYHNLHAVVVPSQTPDPLPRSVMEAMAIGLPTIGYPAGGIPDMIDHGTSGFLAHNADTFLHALKQLMKPTIWQTIQTGGQAKVASHFTMEKLYANLNQTYDAIANRR